MKNCIKYSQILPKTQVMTLQLLTGGHYLAHLVLQSITMHGLKQHFVTPVVSEWGTLL